jgi:glucose/arabinose dehydrogenase
MRRATILSVVATMVPIAVAVGGSATRVAAATVPAGFTDTLVTTLSRPTAVESLPDGRIVVLEQSGRVRAGFPGQALPTVLTLANTCLGGERGLLGFTHDPGYLSNRRVYVYYTRDAPGAPNGCVNRVSRFTMEGVIDPASETVLLDDISSLGGNHNGGDLDVGSDGNLYVSIGDAGQDPRQDGGTNAARDLSLLNGKILRITLDGQPAPGNPLTGAGTEPCAVRGNLPSTPPTSCQELFAWGLRNPYRIAFDPNGGGDRFFINDVGQSSREEVDDGGVGRDYGWNLCEGFCDGGPPAGITDPLTDYPRSVGTVITGGAFVPDGLWPAELDGGYLFGDAGSGSIFLRRADGSVDYDTPWATDAVGIADMVFAFDETGRTALYYTRNGNGQVRKIVWDGQAAPPTPSSLAFGAIAPTRAYDTRTGLGVTAGDVRSDTTRLVDLPTPSPAVQAALVNITVTNNAGWGFLEAWTPRSLRPPTSVVNVVQPGEDVANASVVTLDAQGRFVLHATMATDVVVDVLGWFSTTPGTATAGRFVPVEPGRLIDTRQPSGAQLPSGSSNSYVEAAGRVDLPIAGQIGMPAASGIGAAVVILTALGTTAPQSGFASAHAGGTPVPDASNVNTNGNGDIRANLVVVPVATDGSLSVTLERVDDVLVDVVGYFTPPGAPTSASGLFTAVSPTRLYDERAPGAPTAPAGGTLTLDLDDGGLPAAGGAIAVLQNLTITATTGFDFVTAYPGGGAVPEVSNVNAVAADQTRAALAVTKLGQGATVGYFTFGSSMLVVDAFGYFRS